MNLRPGNHFPGGTSNARAMHVGYLGTGRLLITTGTFTADAKAESTRGGAPPVDLIDGLALGMGVW